MKKYCIICLLFSCLVLPAFAEIPATVQSGANGQWRLENEAMRVDIVYLPEKGIGIADLYGKDASRSYLQPEDGSSLFSFRGQYLFAGDSPKSTTPVSIPFSYNANDRGWTLGESRVEDILMSTMAGKILVGKKLIVNIRKENMGVRLSFEIYNGKAGLRYQTFPKNFSIDYKLMIEESTVISLAFANEEHNLHYVENTQWKSTTGSIQEAPMNNKGKGVAKVLLNRYSSGYGWYMSTEVNWKTQHGPEIPDSNYEYMLRAFAGCTAWAMESENFVQVITHPESLQLVLFPQEEFEYIPVNLNLFKGDIVDGKMAAEEHLRKRFRVNNVRSLWNTNDWDWFTRGNRTETFYKEEVIPQAKAAGLDMLMFDDGWNNANSSGTGLDNSGESRDKVEASQTITKDMVSFTQNIIDNGFKFGLWYSMSGGNHNKGFDLASQDVVDAKREKVEYLINNYKMSHQMVDLTEYWQVTEESNYSHPSDNVYRKNVRTRAMMNELVDKYPQYVVKVTSELDIYPTQGDRCASLGHIPNNGWHTSVGDGSFGAGGMGCFSYSFGHYPMNTMYYGGTPNGSIENYYNLMAARNIKFGTQPDEWDSSGVELMGKFNQWRKSPRMTAIVENTMRPVYMGPGWDSPVAEQWVLSQGPFIWMYVEPSKEKALMVATNNGLVGKEGNFGMPLRWLDNQKVYLVQDITLDDNGTFTYNFKGKYSGEELNKGALKIDMYENSSRGKALWVQASNGAQKQVLYADHFIRSYTETMVGDILRIEVEGECNTEGLVIVYESSSNRICRYPIAINDQGKGTLVVETLEMQADIPYPKFSGSIRYDLEGYHAQLTFSDAQMSASSVFNGNPDSSGGYSSFVGMRTMGNYAIYNLSIPVPGTYDIEVRYKISSGNRGNSQWYIIDGDNETPIGTSYSQSGSPEKMVILKLGSYTFSEAGMKGFKIKLVPGTAIGTNISTDYLNLIYKR